MALLPNLDRPKLSEEAIDFLEVSGYFCNFGGSRGYFGYFMSLGGIRTY